MSLIHQRVTRRRSWRLPARLPRHLRHPGRGARWPGRRLSRRSRSPNHPGLALRQGAPLSGARLRSRPAAVPAAPRRAKGSGEWERITWDEAIAEIADALAGDHRRVRRRGDPALFLQRHARPGANQVSPVPALEPHGRLRPGTLDLRRGRRDGGQADARRTPGA